MRPVQELVKILKQKQLTIAFAESITCGWISHKFGTVAGTSEVFRGSIICYDEKVKVQLLKIKKSLIKKHTAESQQVTDALAENLRKLISADIHAAVTGLASEGGSETRTKPVGTVFFSFLFRKKLYKARKKFNGSPMQIKKKSGEFIFKIIADKIKK
jgi:nicotinamide-nucleotide amidase